MMQPYVMGREHAQSALAAQALTCPRCATPASVGPGTQICPRCGGSFTLRAGYQLDRAAMPPPPDPRLPRIVVKSAGVVLMKRGMVAAEGVSEGTLDPITGFIPMDQAGLLYPDIFTIAVWRKIDVVRLVVTLLIPVPLTLFLLFASIALHVGFLIGAVPFGTISGFLLYDALGWKAHLVRIVGTVRVITIRFDSPMWRRRTFHDELLRRAGISPSAIP